MSRADGGPPPPDPFSNVQLELIAACVYPPQEQQPLLLSSDTTRFSSPGAHCASQKMRLEPKLLMAKE